MQVDEEPVDLNLISSIGLPPHIRLSYGIIGSKLIDDSDAPPRFSVNEPVVRYPKKKNYEDFLLTFNIFTNEKYRSLGPTPEIGFSMTTELDDAFNALHTTLKLLPHPISYISNGLLNNLHKVALLSGMNTRIKTTRSLTDLRSDLLKISTVSCSYSSHRLDRFFDVEELQKNLNDKSVIMLTAYNSAECWRGRIDSRAADVALMRNCPACRFNISMLSKYIAEILFCMSRTNDLDSCIDCMKIIISRVNEPCLYRPGFLLSEIHTLTEAVNTYKEISALKHVQKSFHSGQLNDILTAEKEDQFQNEMNIGAQDKNLDVSNTLTSDPVDASTLVTDTPSAVLRKPEEELSTIESKDERTPEYLDTMKNTLFESSIDQETIMAISRLLSEPAYGNQAKAILNRISKVASKISYVIKEKESNSLDGNSTDSNVVSAINELKHILSFKNSLFTPMVIDCRRIHVQAENEGDDRCDDDAVVRAFPMGIRPCSSSLKDNNSINDNGENEDVTIISAAESVKDVSPSKMISGVSNPFSSSYSNQQFLSQQKNFQISHSVKVQKVVTKEEEETSLTHETRRSAQKRRASRLLSEFGSDEHQNDFHTQRNSHKNSRNSIASNHGAMPSDIEGSIVEATVPAEKSSVRVISNVIGVRPSSKKIYRSSISPAKDATVEETQDIDLPSPSSNDHHPRRSSGAKIPDDLDKSTSISKPKLESNAMSGFIFPVRGVKAIRSQNDHPSAMEKNVQPRVNADSSSAKDGYQTVDANANFPFGRISSLVKGHVIDDDDEKDATEEEKNIEMYLNKRRKMLLPPSSSHSPCIPSASSSSSSSSLHLSMIFDEEETPSAQSDLPSTGNFQAMSSEANIHSTERKIITGIRPAPSASIFSALSSDEPKLFIPVGLLQFRRPTEESLLKLESQINLSSSFDNDDDGDNNDAENVDKYIEENFSDQDVGLPEKTCEADVCGIEIEADSKNSGLTECIGDIEEPLNKVSDPQVASVNNTITLEENATKDNDDALNQIIPSHDDENENENMKENEDTNESDAEGLSSMSKDGNDDQIITEEMEIYNTTNNNNNESELMEGALPLPFFNSSNEDTDEFDESNDSLTLNQNTEHTTGEVNNDEFDIEDKDIDNVSFTSEVDTEVNATQASINDDNLSNDDIDTIMEEETVVHVASSCNEQATLTQKDDLGCQKDFEDKREFHHFSNESELKKASQDTINFEEELDADGKNDTDITAPEEGQIEGEDFFYDCEPIKEDDVLVKTTNTAEKIDLLNTEIRQVTPLLSSPKNNVNLENKTHERVDSTTTSTRIEKRNEILIQNSDHDDTIPILPPILLPPSHASIATSSKEFTQAGLFPLQPAQPIVPPPIATSSISEIVQNPSTLSPTLFLQSIQQPSETKLTGFIESMFLNEDEHPNQ